MLNESSVEPNDFRASLTQSRDNMLSQSFQSAHSASEFEDDDGPASGAGNAEAEDESEHVRENEGFWKFLDNCWTLYDRRTLALIGLQYCNEGGSIMLSLSCTLWFFHKGVEPHDATLYMCIISLPEALSFFWGMFTDNVSIYGKRGHIVIAACL